MFKLLTIIGARPQIIKSAAITRAINSAHDHTIVQTVLHTGQHYDENMSGVFFKELDILPPDIQLKPSDNGKSQLDDMVEGIEKALEQLSPDGVLVYGDTTSTLAGALAGEKTKTPVFHVEAGLRSFNQSMPEEHNRIETDKRSTLLFSPTSTGVENLKSEDITHHESNWSLNTPGVFHTGDVMLDNSLHYAEHIDRSGTILERLNLVSGEFDLCTIHRPVNADDPEALGQILGAMHLLSGRGNKVVLPLHPRTAKTLKSIQSKVEVDNILIIDPVSYLDMIALEKNAAVIMTDSGGVQKEAFFFKRPCIVLREETEWVELVDNGAAFLVGADQDEILSCHARIQNTSIDDLDPLFGKGNAAEEICNIIIQFHQGR